MEGAAPVTTPRRRRTRVIIALAPRRRRRTRVREEALTPLPAPPLKQLMKYAVPTVLALLMLRHQRQPDALFRENPAPLWSFAAATALYWLVADAMGARKRYRMVLRCAALALGIQSVLSLASMFLPYPFSLLPLLASVPLALFLAYTWWLRNRGVNQPHILPLSHKVNRQVENMADGIGIRC